MITPPAIHNPSDRGPLAPAPRRFLSRWRLLAVAALLALVAAGCTGGNIIGSAQGWTPVTISEGVVYAATRHGDVVALDAQALERDEDAGYLWRYNPPEDDELGSVFGPPAVGPDFVYVGSFTNDEAAGGKLIALRKDRRSSQRVEVNEWEETIRGGIIGGPALADGKVLIGSEDGNLYAFDAGTGETLWTFATEGLARSNDKERRIWSTPAIDNGVVYFGAMDDHLYAVSLSDGAELWRFKTEGAVVTTPLVANGMVVFGSFDRTLYALDAASGSGPLWTFTGDNWFWAGSVTDGETVYSVDMDGTVYALPLDRRSEDAPNWTQEVGNAVSSTPALSGDHLIVSTENGVISLLDTANGTVDDIPIEMDEEVRGPLTAAGTGTAARVYFGDKDGVVRALNVDRWRISWTVRTKE